MKISNSTYDCLKWIFTVVIPALLALYGVIGHTCNIPCTEEVLIIGAAVVTCGCSILGISSIKYANSQAFITEMSKVNSIIEEEETEEEIIEEEKTEE